MAAGINRSEIETIRARYAGLPGQMAMDVRSLLSVIDELLPPDLADEPEVSERAKAILRRNMKRGGGEALTEEQLDELMRRAARHSGMPEPDDIGFIDESDNAQIPGEPEGYEAAMAILRRNMKHGGGEALTEEQLDELIRRAGRHSRPPEPGH